VAAFGQARADSVALLAVASAAAVVTASSLARAAVRVPRAARRAAVLAIAGGTVALLGATSAEGSGNVWTWTLATGLACAAIGSAAPVLERPLRPAGGVWLDALARACESS